MSLAGNAGLAFERWRVLVDDVTLDALRHGSDDAWITFAKLLRDQWGQRTVAAVGRSDAEDVLQEVFVRVFSHRERIADGDHLARFVANVWRQRVIDWYRRRAKRRVFTVALQQSEDRPDSTIACDVPDIKHDPHLVAVAQELRNALERTTALSGEERLIVALHVLDGHTFAEIAGLLSRNVKSVETWYARAVEALGHQLALATYRERRADFADLLSDGQKEALGHFLDGRSIREVAKSMHLRVPELANLLAPAWQVLREAALADWLRALRNPACPDRNTPDGE